MADKQVILANLDFLVVDMERTFALSANERSKISEFVLCVRLVLVVDWIDDAHPVFGICFLFGMCGWLRIGLCFFHNLWQMLLESKLSKKFQYGRS